LLLEILRIPHQSSVSLQFCQARFVACNACPSNLQLHMNCRQRTHGRQVMWRCKPLRFRLSETRLTCLRSSCRHAGKRLHGCAAGCASCSKINMLGTVQLPEQLFCPPLTQWQGRLCSIASTFIPTFVHCRPLHEVNIPSLVLHICVANETAAASGPPQGLALCSDSNSCCSLIRNHHSDWIDAMEHSKYCVVNPAFCFASIKL